MKRFIVFGSFVTAKPEPNEVDVFLVMYDTFDLSQVTGEARLIARMEAQILAHFKLHAVFGCISPNFSWAGTPKRQRPTMLLWL